MKKSSLTFNTIWWWFLIVTPFLGHPVIRCTLLRVCRLRCTVAPISVSPRTEDAGDWMVLMMMLENYGETSFRLAWFHTLSTWSLPMLNCSAASRCIVTCICCLLTAESVDRHSSDSVELIIFSAVFTVFYVQWTIGSVKEIKFESEAKLYSAVMSQANHILPPYVTYWCHNLLRFTKKRPKAICITIPVSFGCHVGSELQSPRWCGSDVDAVQPKEKLTYCWEHRHLAQKQQ